ncbi:MAG TPA: hypothetical protein VIQ29_03180 [Ancylobacter sp.]
MAGMDIIDTSRPGYFKELSQMPTYYSGTHSSDRFRTASFRHFPWPVRRDVWIATTGNSPDDRHHQPDP